MISYLQALDAVFTDLQHMEILELEAAQSCGYYLAEEIKSDTDIPPFTNSAMDGYAVRHKDVRDACDNEPAILNILGKSLAGHPYSGKIGRGETVYISTGATIPGGADTVIPVELTDNFSPSRAAILRPLPSGSNIRPAGEDIRAAQTVMQIGDKLTPSRLGILASVGKTSVQVYRKPVVAFLATGDELVAAGEQPGWGQIRNSNSPAMKGMVESCGCSFVDLGIARDTKEDLMQKLLSGKTADVLITSAGVSVGEYDLLPAVLETLGIEKVFWKVAVKPGKPVFFGHLENLPYFGLPGNPVSGAVMFSQIIEPVLLYISGAKKIFPAISAAILQDDIKKTEGRIHFARGYCYFEKHWKVQSSGIQSSHIQTSLADANCLIMVPENRELKKGEEVFIQMKSAVRISLQAFRSSFVESMK